MGITPKKLGKYTLKTYNTPLYTWDPSSFDKKRKRDIGMGTGGKKYYCTATPYSQGEDWISTYSYNIGVTPEGVQQRIAYVACDYVK
jgi:hypothetical protein